MNVGKSTFTVPHLLALATKWAISLGCCWARLKVALWCICLQHMRAVRVYKIYCTNISVASADKIPSDRSDTMPFFQNFAMVLEVPGIRSEPVAIGNYDRTKG